jgi:hypothetical protein
MKIYAPVKDANGVWATVRFVDGVGETDNPALIEWFRRHGYRVPLEESTPVSRAEEILDQVIETVEEPAEPNLDEMTPNELRDWAKSNGYGSVIKNTRDKEKLLKLIRG